MYGHSHSHNINDPYSFSLPEFLSESGSPQQPPHGYMLQPPALAIPPYEFDSMYESPSNYSASPSMATERSGSSHSIATQFHNADFFNQPVSSPTEIFDFEGSSSTTMRRVFSADDFQGTNMVHSHSHRSESPISSESNSIIESMNRACRYSPDEKRERIERYRNKKTQRNFTKKIKYVCRKTLADSRPRIRGRFARNDEIEKDMEHQLCTSHEDGQEAIDYDDEQIWNNIIIDSFPPNFIP